MDFALGDTVQYKDAGLEAVVIAIDVRDSEFILLGWKEGECRCLSALRTGDIRLIRTDQYLPDWNTTYKWGWWEYTRNLIGVKCRKQFTKVNPKTLRKRMRDQIAQEALSFKE